MALTPSTMLPLGTALPDVALPDVHGGVHRLHDLGERGLLVLFLSVHCPYVIHVRGALGPLAAALAEQGIATVGVHSNDIASYPADAPDQVAKLAAREGWGFPQLVDADQSFARSLSAACTPDAFLFDGAGALVYRGQLDDSRPGRGQASGESVRRAAERLAAGLGPLGDQRPSTGCNIKWKAGAGPSGWVI